MTYLKRTMHGDVKSVGTRIFCKKCAEITAFFRSKCLVCGTAYVRKAYGGRQPMSWQTKLKLGRRQANIREDRNAYLKRMAEESRKKFEGPK